MDEVPEEDMSSPKLLPYAINFCSYLLQHLPEKKLQRTRTIVFFGSGARDEAPKGSDVDLFIEVEGKTKEIDHDIDRITEDFYGSVKYTRYWQLLGVTQPLSIKVGNLKEGKAYPGLVERYHAQRLSKGSILVAVEYGQMFHTLAVPPCSA